MADLLQFQGANANATYVSSTNPLPVTLSSGAGAAAVVTEDAAAPANPSGGPIMLVREDARAGSLTTTDGDVLALRGNNLGEAYVKDTDAQTARGGVTETAPASDTASSGLNGRLQRIAQRLTSLITLQMAPTTGAQTSVASAASDTTILASNASRKGACITNDDANILYLLLANATSSATAYSVQVPGNGGYYELPVCQGGVYTGIIKGIWAADGAGSARVTELT